ncbi:MAG TPA: iron-containing redox enzyme family protein [Blastocatellia bacterium]|jgi:pyrroloquinoline-quinone synthase
MSQQIRQRVAFQDTEMVGYLDEWKELILRHRGTNHPFLNNFRAKRTSPEAIKRVFLEFYYFVRHLPFYIAGMALLTRDERVLREIIINVTEEVGERDKTPHLDIYRNFMRRAGITETEIAHYICLESTRKIDTGIEKLYTKSSIEKALGAMYALETMSSEMVGKLNDALELNGFDEETRSFFIFHIESEKGHSNGAFNAIFPYLTIPANRVLFEEGLKEFMTLIESFWDGVSSICHQADDAIQ